MARDTVLNVTGRDTIKIISLDPSFAASPLKELPPLVLVSGQADSTVQLNEFLPDDVSNPAQTIWRVSGQQITTPSIAIDPPHRLTLQSVGDRVGVDTLAFVVNLGGGLTASGTMVVTVQEPVDESTLELQVVPNLFNQEFIDVYVLARRGIAGTPNVVRTFEGADSTVAVRQIEEDLEGRRVLVWSGNVQLRPGASGTIFFTAQALTSLGTPVGDTASVTVLTTVAAKVATIDHAGIQLQLGADAVPEGTRIIVQVDDGEQESAAAKRDSDSELRMRSRIKIYPLGMELRSRSSIRLLVGPSTEGLYDEVDGAWRYLGGREERIPIGRLGMYAVLDDPIPPSVVVRSLPEGGTSEFSARITDHGSGLDPAEITFLVNGAPVAVEFEDDRLTWSAGSAFLGGPTELILQVKDRAGNEVMKRFVILLPDQSLPLVFSLGANYPNPFNPETTIPFAVPEEATLLPVRLAIYNISGQLVRQLLAREVSAGQHELQWDARDESGGTVSSGIYFYRLESGNRVLSRSMMLLK